MAKRRIPYGDGSPEIKRVITLNKTTDDFIATQAKAAGHSFDQELHGGIEARMSLRNTIQSFPHFKHRYVSPEEVRGFITSSMRTMSECYDAWVTLRDIVQAFPQFADRQDISQVEILEAVIKELSPKTPEE